MSKADLILAVKELDVEKVRQHLENEEETLKEYEIAGLFREVFGLKEDELFCAKSEEDYEKFHAIKQLLLDSKNSSSIFDLF
jgi:hypothetical protein